MKKDYMKPEGNLVALQANENIATSGAVNGGAVLNYGVYYLEVSGTKYIMGNTGYPASSTGDEKFDCFYDLIISYIHNLDPACRF